MNIEDLGTGQVLGTVIVLLLVERGLELFVDARHRRRLVQEGGHAVGPDGFGGILFAQAAMFIVPVGEVLVAPWTRLGPWSLVGIALLVIAQVIRWWSIRTLGHRWTLRVWVVPDMPRITTGPYRFLRHPNYVAVIVEYIAMPLVVGAWVSLAIVTILGVAAALRRIAVEEAALTASAP